MALGALALSKQKAIVSRLSAIEEMAGVDILCSDKTGTLTKNQLKLDQPILLASNDAREVILAAALASKIEDRDVIDTAVVEALKGQNLLKSCKQTKFVPFDPVTKRTAATVSDAQGRTFVVSKGAPQAIVDLAKAADDVAARVKQTVMFLQIVLGGHFLLYSTRTAKWFFQPPLPSLPLNAALWATNILAILMCAFGWLVPELSWTAIGWVLAYSVVWLVVMDAIKRATYAFADYATSRHRRSTEIVYQSLQPHVPAASEPGNVA